MEVHHHPDLHHRRKKLREYFLEFLMIFMAVTLGFLAESLRENLSDSHKEKEYIVSLIENIKNDTFQIAESISENQVKLDTLIKLMSLSRTDLSTIEERRSIYHWTNRAVGYYSIFESNDATMMQLKNSGGLRFIHKDHVADSIAKYDGEMKAIYGAAVLSTTSTDAAIFASHDILDYSILYDSAYMRGGRLDGSLLPLITTDRQKLKLYYNKVSFEIGGTQNYLNNMRERYPFMIRMIAYLKKEYSIE